MDVTGMEVKQCISMTEAAVLLGVAVKLAAELIDEQNLETDMLGKPLGVWLKADLIDTICEYRGLKRGLNEWDRDDNPL